LTYINPAMTTSTKKANPNAHTTKAGPTRTRTQTEKGKYNARNQKKKRIVEESYSEESSEEETRRPQKKRSKLAEDTDPEEVDSNASNIEDVVEVTSNDGSESDFQVSILHCFAKHSRSVTELTVKGNVVEDVTRLAIPGKFNCKKDMAQDVRLLFSDRMKVKFTKGGTTKTLEGRWCITCR
jgi:hypothetical protein